MQIDYVSEKGTENKFLNQEEEECEKDLKQITLRRPQ